VLPPLYIYGEKGGYSAEVKSIFSALSALS